MMGKKRIFIFTTTRADYGLLKWIIDKLQSSSEFEVYVVGLSTFTPVNSKISLFE